MKLKNRHLVKGSLKTRHGWLAAAVDLVAGHPPEVGTARNRVLQLLDLVKVVGHGGQLADIAHQVAHPNEFECRWGGGDCLEKVEPGLRSAPFLGAEHFFLSPQERITASCPRLRVYSLRSVGSSARPCLQISGPCILHSEGGHKSRSGMHRRRAKRDMQAAQAKKRTRQKDVKVLLSSPHFVRVAKSGRSGRYMLPSPVGSAPVVSSNWSMT